MVKVPAICNECGLIFPTAIEIGTPAHVTVKDIGWLCPRGHTDSKILDGIYSSLGDGLLVLLTTPDAQTRLKTLLHSLELAKTPNEVKSAINEHTPELSEGLTRTAPTGKGGFHKWVNSITLIITCLLAIYNTVATKSITNR